MPEVITRYPETALKVLRDAGAACGAGAEQRILTSCPAERFCQLPTGELCVYGVSQAGQATQFNQFSLLLSGWPMVFLGTLVVLSLAAGMLAAWWVLRREGSRPQPRRMS